jgi:predicted alpha/beta hydrolase family esterase
MHAGRFCVGLTGLRDDYTLEAAMAARNHKSKPTPRNKTQPSSKLPALDARRDTLDFRDKMYVPTLIEVPLRVELEQYLQHHIPILDQGAEGACTGFGLATVAHYLLATRKVVPDCEPVSPRMLYEMAKRYDEWPGEDYSGSSARGAMKGWHKHGVCSEVHWPHVVADPAKRRGAVSGLNAQRMGDAVRRPLGAYFRVNHKDIVAMHAALAEVGILYATADVHVGWESVGADGIIAYCDELRGGHAFAIVAFDANGFWIQNSWGPKWGRQGFACIGYDDWLQHGSDVWVARLGAPIKLAHSAAAATAHSATSGQSVGYAYAELRPHLISIGDDGELSPGGDYGTSRAEVVHLFRNELPLRIANDGYKHLLLYAPSGLVNEKTAVQRLADYRPALLAAGVYPLSLIWHSDYWTTLKNLLQDAFSRRRPEGILDAAKDFMLDRLDDALEPMARSCTGKAVWDEIKRNALAATRSAKGGAKLTAHLVASLAKRHKIAVHLLAHSAGSVLHAPLVSELKRLRVPIESCTLWAPACSIELFKQHYLPLLNGKDIKRFALFTLSDQAERDDHCADIYHKSLLYLVANALEAKPRIPVIREIGVPLLGLERCVQADGELQALFKTGHAEHVIGPNNLAPGSARACGARHHGDFDNDAATVQAAFQRITGGAVQISQLRFHRSAAALRERRMRADQTR